ncbi:hypothetical protein FGO68_gene7267 [Halteria grandinella]|uniref:Uncharacterized protein n=1 Tax=Halteria grandinella TaxID=5974 RepID=A0A8J8NPA3_HALGN|nr:hypothetical protein FGO68_gene7267 [Halteria grandinella]
MCDLNGMLNDLWYQQVAVSLWPDQLHSMIYPFRCSSAELLQMKLLFRSYHLSKQRVQQALRCCRISNTQYS